jgi:peroxiredoxin family protein
MKQDTSSKIIDTEKRIKQLEIELFMLKEKIEEIQHHDSVAIICFSGEWDKLFAAFTIANGAISLGKEVHMFFTFWGATAMRDKNGKTSKRKSFSQKAIGKMLPTNINATSLSKLNFYGLGKILMKKEMKKQNIDDLQTLMKQAHDLGAHFHCCDTSLQLLGFDCDELIQKDKTDWCGVSSFLSIALESRVTLFI